MKTLKRVLAVAMVPGIVFALSACGGKDMSGSPYCGTWTATTAEYSGMELSVSDLYENGFTVDLGADGKATVDTDDETAACVWEENDTGVALKQSEDILMIDDGNGGLYIEQDYEQDYVTIYFEKQ